MQFHPTALDADGDPMPLVSEALRGDGAVLIDETGTRFMAGQGRAELEPRDIVARAVWRHLGAGHRVFLDTRTSLGADLPRRFPGITRSCRAAGIDPVTAPIPIRPAAHYHMGGVAVDAKGRTNIPGLWACGETAATGLHGANRLASNSLLEAAVTGIEVARDLAGSSIRRVRPGTRPTPLPVPDPAGLLTVRTLMNAHLGLLRDRAGLEQALVALAPIAAGRTAAAAPAQVALMITAAALARRESRGGHYRTDFPAHDPALAVRRPITLSEAIDLAETICGQARRIAAVGD
jgi:L-aspartate oxidase